MTAPRITVVSMIRSRFSWAALSEAVKPVCAEIVELERRGRVENARLDRPLAVNPG